MALYDLLLGLIHPPTRKGHNAWKALKAFNEGDSMNSRMKNAAYSSLIKAITKVPGATLI
jgi:hypothetical protein